MDCCICNKHSTSQSSFGGTTSQSLFGGTMPQSSSPSSFGGTASQSLFGGTMSQSSSQSPIWGTASQSLFRGTTSQSSFGGATLTTSQSSFSYGVPTYTICTACYDGAQNIINLINKLETENVKTTASTTYSSTSSCKSLLNASEWVVGLTKKQSFFHEMVDAYRNLTPSDILLKPGNNGSPIATHRALLASRSKIFKNMLESDTCKTSHMETITMSELNHEELEALIEFLYVWSLPQQKLEKHIYPLSLAAHKYEIISLLEVCQNYMRNTLNSRNALVILEISDFCSFLTIRDMALSFIVKHGRDIFFAAEYEAFAAKNPHLSVQITRALFKQA